MPAETLEDGIITINTETAESVVIAVETFKDLGSEVVETVTAKEFE